MKIFAIVPLRLLTVGVVAFMLEGSIIACGSFTPATDLDQFKNRISAPSELDRLELLRFNLGWRLFYDPILSNGRDRTCGSCHISSQGMADGLPMPKSRIAGALNRNTKTVINAGLLDTLLWSGRTVGLSNQLLVPLTNPAEMGALGIDSNSELLKITNRIANITAYRAWFKKAYPDQPQITIRLIADAIQKYEMGLRATDSRFDKIIEAKTSPNSREKEAIYAFTVIDNCVSCHSGFLLTDQKLHLFNGALIRTPSLRNCVFTSPYAHDGSCATIDEVIRAHAEYSSLTWQQLEPLKVFLEITSDSSWRAVAEPPAEVPSGIQLILNK